VDGAARYVRERHRGSDLFGSRHVRIDVLRNDAEQRRRVRERIEPVAFDPVDRRPDDGLLAHDAARIAAPVVAKAAYPTAPVPLRCCRPGLRCTWRGPRVVVVDGSVRAAVREGVGILNVNVDAAERVDQSFVVSMRRTT